MLNCSEVLTYRINRAPGPYPLTYEELLHENEKLRLAFAGMRPPLYANTAGNFSSTSIVTVHDRADEYEKLLFDSAVYEPRPRAQSVNDIKFPSRQCSNSILNYGRVWTSCVHFALDHPTFEKEHDAFWDSSSNGHVFDSLDPLWIAIYFSVISVSYTPLLNRSTDT
jgi:hypothetical protein